MSATSCAKVNVWQTIRLNRDAPRVALIQQEAKKNQLVRESRIHSDVTQGIVQLWQSWNQKYV